MTKLLETIKNQGLRKMAMGSEFFVGLCLMGYCKVIDSPDWKGCFEILCFCVFTANAAEHFAKKDKGVTPTTPVV
jgi:hypothetical protein